MQQNAQGAQNKVGWLIGMPLAMICDQYELFPQQHSTQAGVSVPKGGNRLHTITIHSSVQSKMKYLSN